MVILVEDWGFGRGNPPSGRNYRSRTKTLGKKDMKEKKFKLQNPNFVLNPKRIVMRNLPLNLTVNELKD